MKILVHRWVLNHEIINPKNVWMSKSVVFGPKRKCICYEDCCNVEMLFVEKKT